MSSIVTAEATSPCMIAIPLVRHDMLHIHRLFQSESDRRILGFQASHVVWRRLACSSSFHVTRTSKDVRIVQCDSFVGYIE